MFTFGDAPNLQQKDQLSGEEIATLLEQGVRLHCPAFCPADVYKSIMMYCWDINPKARPTFAELLRIIDDFLNVNGERI
jgi:hypothetical protein